MIAEKNKKIAVVGMGNQLGADDGIGIHVLHELDKEHFENVDLIDAGTAVIHTADALRDADHIIVVDALRAGHRPGTLYLMSGGALFENGPSLSVHSLGLRTALRFMAPGKEEVDWTLVGVEPARSGTGTELSEPVRNAVAGAVRTVENLIEEWQV